MWIEALLTIYGALALGTYLYIMTDKEVQSNGLYIILFFILSLFWPLVWLVYLISRD